MTSVHDLVSAAWKGTHSRANSLGQDLIGHDVDDATRELEALSTKYSAEDYRNHAVDHEAFAKDVEDILERHGLKLEDTAGLSPLEDAIEGVEHHVSF